MNKKQERTFLFLLVCGLVLVIAYPHLNLQIIGGNFSDGFETGNLGAWTWQYVQTGNSITPQTTNVHTGTYSAKATIGTASTGALTEKTVGGAVSTINARGYFLFDAFPSTYSSLKFMTIKDSANQEVAGVFFMPTTSGFGKAYVNLFETNTGGGGAVFPCVLNQYYCWEIQLTRGAGNGTINVWVDGTSRYENTAADTDRGFDYQKVDVGNLWSEVAGSIYVDDVAIADSYIGLSTSGGSSPSVTISPSSASISEGASQTFTSTVTGGYAPYSYNWFVNGSSVGNNQATYTVNNVEVGSSEIYVVVTDNAAQTATSNTVTLTVTVLATPPPTTGNTATIVLSATTGGSISPSLGSHTYSIGDTFTATASANSGFQFDYWLFSNGTQVTGSPLSFVVDNSYSIQAVFSTVSSQPTVTEQPYTILLLMGICVSVIAGVYYARHRK